MGTPESRDNWSKFEIIMGAFGALGSVAIPVVVFAVGNQISERQRRESDRQLEADRVERMLGHLASDKPDEKRLAVKVLEFFVSQDQFPADLLPAIVEIARSAKGEDLSDSASQVLQKVADSANEPQLAKVAREELSALPPRVDVHSAAGDGQRADTALADLAHENIVVNRQEKLAEAPKQTELRYYRKEDASQAKQVAGELDKRGIRASVRDLSGAPGQKRARPRKFDLMLAE